jgi:hypothetical protein
MKILLIQVQKIMVFILHMENVLNAIQIAKNVLIIKITVSRALILRKNYIILIQNLILTIQMRTILDNIQKT